MFEWDEWSINTGLNIPLELTRGRTFQSLEFSSQYSLINKVYRNKPRSDNFNVGAIDNKIDWVISSQQAQQQLFPRWGLATSIQYQFLVSEFSARQYSLKANAFLPGLKKTHNWLISMAFQGRDTLNQYFFSNSFPISRGYAAVNLPSMFSLSTSYHFPIAYPDWGFGNILYLLRIRGNVFFDHNTVSSLRLGRSWNLNSIGTEIFMDTKWWNQQRLSFGIRISKLLSDGPYTSQPNPVSIQFILPVGF